MAGAKPVLAQRAARFSFAGGDGIGELRRVGLRRERRGLRDKFGNGREPVGGGAQRLCLDKRDAGVCCPSSGQRVAQIVRDESPRHEKIGDDDNCRDPCALQREAHGVRKSRRVVIHPANPYLCPIAAAAKERRMGLQRARGTADQRTMGKQDERGGSGLRGF